MWLSWWVCKPSPSQWPRWRSCASVEVSQWVQHPGLSYPGSAERESGQGGYLLIQAAATLRDEGLPENPVDLMYPSWLGPRGRCSARDHPSRQSNPGVSPRASSNSNPSSTAGTKPRNHADPNVCTMDELEQSILVNNTRLHTATFRERQGGQAPSRRMKAVFSLFVFERGPRRRGFFPWSESSGPEWPETEDLSLFPGDGPSG
jgi:hypothetical protein